MGTGRVGDRVCECYKDGDDGKEVGEEWIRGTLGERCHLFGRRGSRRGDEVGSGGEGVYG